MTAQGQEDRHAVVDVAVRSWRQGDCILGDHWFVYRFDPGNPLTEASEAIAAEDVDLAETNVRGLVVTSQTCDIVRSSAQRPFVEVAPLVEVEPTVLPSIERARRPQYAFIPGIRERNLVADLDRSMCIEKAVLAGSTRVTGCTTDQERRQFAQALARKRTRFAFPDDFTQLADRLQKRMQKKHDKDSDDGRALRALREIRVRAAPSWDAAAVTVTLFFVRNDDEPTFEGKSWDELLEVWLELIPSNGRFELVSGVVVTLDDLTARGMVESDPLDLDHLSPPA